MVRGAQRHGLVPATERIDSDEKFDITNLCSRVPFLI
jgi:hypothetical protein